MKQQHIRHCRGVVEVRPLVRGEDGPNLDQFSWPLTLRALERELMGARLQLQEQTAHMVELESAVERKDRTIDNLFDRLDTFKDRDAMRRRTLVERPAAGVH